MSDTPGAASALAGGLEERLSSTGIGVRNLLEEDAVDFEELASPPGGIATLR